MEVSLGPFPHNYQIKSMTESIKRPRPSLEQIVSGGMKQNKIDDKMKEIVDKFKDYLCWSRKSFVRRKIAIKKFFHICF